MLILHKNKRKMEATKISIPRFMQFFQRFSQTERLKIVEKINQQTFEERWQLLDEELPDVGLSENEIMDEVRAVRYGKN